MNEVIEFCMKTHTELHVILKEYQWVMTNHKQIPYSHITEKTSIHIRNLEFIYMLIDKSYSDLCNGTNKPKELMFLTSQLVVAYNYFKDTLMFVKNEYADLESKVETKIIRKFVDFRNSLVHPILNYRKMEGYLTSNEILYERNEEITLMDIKENYNEWTVKTETIDLGDVFTFIIALRKNIEFVISLVKTDSDYCTGLE